MGCIECALIAKRKEKKNGCNVIQPSNQTFECMGDIAHYQLHPKKAALSAALTKSGPLHFPLSCSPIFFFRVVTSQILFLASTPVWTAIESVNFTDFVQRAAIAII